MIQVPARRLVDRISEHLIWRLDPAVRTSRKLHALAPDVVSLYGVELVLGEWATPVLRRAVYDGWYEASEREIVEATTRPCERVLEIGCGIGFVATTASKHGATVRSYEGNPGMVAVGRRTFQRNRANATVTNAILVRHRDRDTVPFYVHVDFWASSLTPAAAARAVDVPVLDFVAEIEAHEASYLIIDAEGAEIDILGGPLPASVRRLCVECHQDVTGNTAVSAMLAGLVGQGFSLDLVASRPPVMYLERGPVTEAALRSLPEAAAN